MKREVCVETEESKEDVSLMQQTVFPNRRTVTPGVPWVLYRSELYIYLTWSMVQALCCPDLNNYAARCCCTRISTLFFHISEQAILLSERISRAPRAQNRR